MTIVSDPPGLGAYAKDDVIWAEHGHRYCLFNAPDTWSRPGGHLPLGYFITRLAASKAALTREVTTTPEVLEKYLKSPSEALVDGPGASAPAGSGGKSAGFSTTR